MPARNVNGAPPDDHLVVAAHARRRTALVALHGELDLVTVSKVAEVIDDLEPQAAGLRLRGTKSIQRVLELTGVDEQLVLVDDPDDLVPPPRPD